MIFTKRLLACDYVFRPGNLDEFAMQRSGVRLPSAPLFVSCFSKRDCVIWWRDPFAVFNGSVIRLVIRLGEQKGELCAHRRYPVPEPTGCSVMLLDSGNQPGGWQISADSQSCHRGLLIHPDFLFGYADGRLAASSLSFMQGTSGAGPGGSRRRCDVPRVRLTVCGLVPTPTLGSPRRPVA